MKINKLALSCMPFVLGAALMACSLAMQEEMLQYVMMILGALFCLSGIVTLAAYWKNRTRCESS